MHLISGGGFNLPPRRRAISLSGRAVLQSGLHSLARARLDRGKLPRGHATKA